MAYEVILHKNAQRFFNKLDNSIKKQIARGLEKLKKNPNFGKPLSGNLFSLRSLREGKFRILYKVEDEKLLIFFFFFGHRKEIYQCFNSKKVTNEKIFKESILQENYEKKY